MLYLRIASILFSIFLATKQLKLFYKVRFRVTIHCFIVLPVIKWKGITIVGTDDSRGEMLRVLTITSLKRWNISNKENKVVERGCGVEQTPFFSFQVPTSNVYITNGVFIFIFLHFFLINKQKYWIPMLDLSHTHPFTRQCPGQKTWCWKIKSWEYQLLQQRVKMHRETSTGVCHLCDHYQSLQDLPASPNRVSWASIKMNIRTDWWSTKILRPIKFQGHQWPAQRARRAVFPPLQQ